VLVSKTHDVDEKGTSAGTSAAQERETDFAPPQKTDSSDDWQARWLTNLRSDAKLRLGNDNCGRHFAGGRDRASVARGSRSALLSRP